MLAFLRGEADVLVCTTIIESGLDMPRVNTILIDRADALGLAQLYQLRGRVGRSRQRAYAYLLVPGDEALTDDAQRRLEAIQELAELGGGFRLANMDLEIRGAGNLLGTRAVRQPRRGRLRDLHGAARGGGRRAARQRRARARSTPRSASPIAARLPEAYVPEVSQRLVLYKRLVERARRRGGRAHPRRAARPLRPAAGRSGEPARGDPPEAARARPRPPGRRLRRRRARAPHAPGLARRPGAPRRPAERSRARA